MMVLEGIITYFMDKTKVLGQLFGKGNKQVDEVIKFDPSKQINNNVQTDVEFIKDVQAIIEHAENLEEDIFAKRANLTEEEYEFVEQVGELHYEANRFNDTMLKDEKEIKPEDKCKCGCNRAKGDPLPYCIDEDKNSFFGEGIILFFYFTKRIILLILMAIVVFFIYSFATNMGSNGTNQNCDKPGVFPFLCQLKIRGEVENKKDNGGLLMGQLWFAFIFCFLWNMGIRLIRKFGRQKSQQIDEQLESSSDQTIFLQKLPLKQYHERDLLWFIQQLWNKLEQSKEWPLKIKSVQIIYDMQSVRKLIANIKKLAKELKGCLQKQTKDNQQTLKVPYTIIDKKLKQYKAKKRQIGRRYDELKKFRQKFIKSEDFRARYSSECALVQFADSKQQAIFLNQYGMMKSTVVKKYLAKFSNYLFNTSDDLIFKGRYINISKAPEPSDIFWLHCQKKVKLRRTLLVWIISILFNFITFGFLFLIMRLKQWNPGANSLGILSIIIVNCFNRIIWTILLNMIFIEKNYTKTINIMSVMNKSYASQLINIIIIPILLNTVMKQQFTVDSPTGLAGQTHDFQLTSFLVMTFFNIIKLPHRAIQVIKKFKCLRRPVIKYFCRVSGEFDSYQEMKEAITFLYDPPLVPVAGLYVYITSITAQAIFFCYLNPIVILYLLINVSLFHLMNRYIVFKMSKITDMIDISVFETITGFYLNIPLLVGIAGIVFLSIHENSYHFGYYFPCLLCLILWIMSSQNLFKLASRFTEFLVKVIKQRLLKKSQKYMKKTKTQKKQLSDMPHQSKHQILDDQHKQKRIQKSQIHLNILEDANNMLSTMRTSGKLMKETKSEIEQRSEGNQSGQVIMANQLAKIVMKRKENYFAAIGTNQLFNFQSKLEEVKGKYHGYCKQFCESFYLNTKQVQMNEYQIEEKQEKKKKIFKELEAAENQRVQKAQKKLKKKVSQPSQNEEDILGFLKDNLEKKKDESVDVNSILQATLNNNQKDKLQQQKILSKEEDKKKLQKKKSLEKKKSFQKNKQQEKKKQQEKRKQQQQKRRQQQKRKQQQKQQEKRKQKYNDTLLKLQEIEIKKPQNEQKNMLKKGERQVLPTVDNKNQESSQQQSQEEQEKDTDTDKEQQQSSESYSSSEQSSDSDNKQTKKHSQSSQQEQSQVKIKSNPKNLKKSMKNQQINYSQDQQNFSQVDD